MASIKKSNNTISGLFSHSGEWVTRIREIQNLLVAHFKDLFQRNKSQAFPWERISTLYPYLEQLNDISRTFSHDEIHQALQSMSLGKAPGPDGFSLGFYQINWELVKECVCHLITQLFEGSRDIAPFNTTLIVLIPKTKQSRYIDDWRLISLYNTTYEILSKIICLRLKPFMPILLPLIKGVFTMGKGAIDNTSIVYEIIHSILIKTRG